MIGLIIFLVAAIYLALWLAVVLFSYGRALRKGYLKKKAFSVGGFFSVVMCLIPSWDLIPTLGMHSHPYSKITQLNTIGKITPSGSGTPHNEAAIYYAA